MLWYDAVDYRCDLGLLETERRAKFLRDCRDQDRGRRNAALTVAAVVAIFAFLVYHAAFPGHASHSAIGSSIVAANARTQACVLNVNACEGPP